MRRVLGCATLVRFYLCLAVTQNRPFRSAQDWTFRPGGGIGMVGPAFTWLLVFMSVLLSNRVFLSWPQPFCGALLWKSETAGKRRQELKENFLDGLRSGTVHTDANLLIVKVMRSRDDAPEQFAFRGDGEPNPETINLNIPSAVLYPQNTWVQG